MSRPRAALAMSASTPDEVFHPASRDRLATLVEVDLGAPVRDYRAVPDVEVLITGWGAPRLDAATLGAMPKLRAIIHSAGTVKTFLDDAVFDHDIVVSSAADANAVPVAEFTFAAVVFGAKRALPLARRYSRQRRSRDLSGLSWLGTNGITVGVVGASRIGRRVVTLLQQLDVRVKVHDPFVADAEIIALGAQPSKLDPLLATSQIVTLHAPATPATTRLLDARRLALLADGAVLINTSRGALIDHQALVSELRSGRIDAILDVSDPEPPPAESELYSMPNVLLTPHIAGALGNEVSRLGESAVSELARFVAGRPLEHEIGIADWDRIA